MFFPTLFAKKIKKGKLLVVKKGIFVFGAMKKKASALLSKKRTREEGMKCSLRIIAAGRKFDRY